MNHVASFDDIQPTMDGDALAKITFTIRVADELGNEVSEVLTGTEGFSPPASDAGYTGAELLAICKAIAERSATVPHLDTLLGAKRTPTYTAPLPPPPLTDDEQKAILKAQVDANAAAIYAQFTRFQIGYELREQAAIAYRDSGYTAAPSSLITRFADNKGLSYPVATRIILSQAATLRGAVVQLEDFRMDKYKVENATTLADAKTEFGEILASMYTLARSLA